MRKSILVVFVDVKIVSIPKLTDEWTWYKLTYVRQSTLFFVYGYIFIFIEYFEKSRVFFVKKLEGILSKYNTKDGQKSSKKYRKYKILLD